jgi:uncharacterized protein (TIGR03437 family)
MTLNRGDCGLGRIVVALFWAVGAHAQVITTIAGTSFNFPLDPVQALKAPLGVVTGVATDSAGNFYLASPSNSLVLRVTPDGTISIVAGNGTVGFSGDGGPATSAALNNPTGVAVDSSGTLFIADEVNHRIRSVSGGIITTVAGSNAFQFSGDGGLATSAGLDEPYAVAVDSAGRLYIADYGSNRIRQVSNGIITTVVGPDSLNFPYGVAVDSVGNLFIADTYNGRILKVSGGVITTVSAGFSRPYGVAVDSAGNIFVADHDDNRVREVSGGILTTIAGNGKAGFSGDGGPAASAVINQPTGVAIDSSGNLLILDNGNSRVRRVSGGIISTVAGSGGNLNFSGDGDVPTSATLSDPRNVVLDSQGNIFIYDTDNGRVREISAGRINTVAGNGTFGFSGDGGPATDAAFNSISGIAVDSVGNLFIADSYNNRIRKVTGGIITTIAGNGTAGFSGDGGPPGNATLDFPRGLATDSAGNLFIVESDFPNCRIRKISSGIISTVAGNGNCGFSGDGGPATAASIFPIGVTVDATGNIFIADTFNQVIRRVTGGIISTIAGNGTAGFSGDGGPATSAAFNEPIAVAVDLVGNIFVADYKNDRIRRISGGIITTVVGNGMAGFSGDGGPATNATLNVPESVTLDASDNIYIPDGANNRIREVIASAPSFQISTATLTFSAIAGGAAPPPQAFTLSSAVARLAYSISTSSSWLSASPSSGSIPVSVQISVDPSQLAAGSYTGSVTITAPDANPSTQTIAISVSISPAQAGKLAVSASSLPFSLSQGAVPASAQLTISNQGSGSILYTASVSGGNWLQASPSSGSVSPASSAALTVTVDPGALAPGTYNGTVTIAGAGQNLAVTVTLAVTAPQQEIVLSQLGYTFTAVAQGGTVLPQRLGILNTGSGTLNYSAQASTQSGGSWLSVSTTSGTVVRPFLDVTYIDLQVDASSLVPGTYYGKVQVSSTGAGNSPQTALVVLTVLPPGSNPGPDVRPTGLVFTGIVGAETPGAQSVTVANLTANPIAAGSGLAYVGSTGWINYLPTDFTVQPSSPVQIVVQPNFQNLPAGPHRAALTLAFDDGTIRTISILAVLAPEGGTSTGSFKSDTRDGSGCSPTKLLPLFTQVGFGAAVTFGYPAAVSVKIADDCGQLVTQGSVQVSFSNGDAPISLTSLQDGEWTNSWAPGRVTATVTLSAYARSGNLTGSAQADPVSLIQGSQTPPMLSQGPLGAGTLTQGPFAPGDLMLLKGTGLADAQASSSAVTTQLAGASLVIGGLPASLLYADSSQVVGLVPSGLPPNTSQQVIVARDDAYGTPAPVIIAATHPAILTKDSSGQGQGLVYASNGQLADSSNPVKSGDTIIVYCFGLGATDASGNAMNAPVMTIGGQAAQVMYAGTALAKNYPPGGAPMLLGVSLAGTGGLYQVTGTIPSGLPNGQASILISSAEQTSPAGVMLAIAGSSAGPVVTSINTAYGSSDISQNDFIEIHGANLAAAPAGPASLSSQLGGVTVSVNGMPALLYYVSPTQINALTPLDSTTGPVSVAVTSTGASSVPYTANQQTVTPAFLRFGDDAHVTATHADGSLLGPTSLGSAFTPATPGETIVTYAVGFGLPSTSLVSGSPSQSGQLPTLPACQIGGAPATVAFAGLNGFAGLYQLNLVVPTSAANGDNLVSCTYGGQSTPSGTLVSVQR